jgi:hypothetical protein
MQFPLHRALKCRAQTRSGQPCQAPAMPNGRCRMHGGMSPGSTLLGLLLVKTQWPARTTAIYKQRLRLETQLVHDLIGLEFVAKLTRCIGSLIYYPL